MTKSSTTMSHLTRHRFVGSTAQSSAYRTRSAHLPPKGIGMRKSSAALSSTVKTSLEENCTRGSPSSTRGSPSSSPGMDSGGGRAALLGLPPAPSDAPSSSLGASFSAIGFSTSMRTASDIPGNL